MAVAKGNSSATNQTITSFSGPAWPDKFGKFIEGYYKEALAKPIGVLSLFSGAGGLDIGFHQAGFRSLEMVEIDNRFASTLIANSGLFGMFGGANIHCMDIRKFKPSILKGIDFIIGGPPCQTFSAAGRRAGGVLGTSDSRGQLFQTYVELLKQIQPRGFLYENVYGITGANGGDDWRMIKESFADAGYTVTYRILDTADYGVPQHRERMIIVGTQNCDFNFPRPTHGPDSFENRPFFTACEALKSVPKDENNQLADLNGRYGHLLKEIPPGLNYSFFTEKLGHPKPLFAWRSKFSDFLYKADPDKPVRTIKAQGGQYTGPFHWDNRPFTTNELKRLQTFPDDYNISGGRTTVIHQIGNSVPPQLSRMLAISIMDQVFRVKPPVELPTMLSNDALSFRKLKRERSAYYLDLANNSTSASVVSSKQKAKPFAKYFELTPDFQFLPSGSKSNSAYVVFKDYSTKWQIQIQSNKSFAEPKYSVTVTPAYNKTWNLPCNEILLTGSKLDHCNFISAWKALEHVLQINNLKADLVQLNGYYQYSPSISASIKYHQRTDWKWKSLSDVVAGIGARKPLSTLELSNELEIPPNQIPEFAKFLKKLGYEIRNKNTNPKMNTDQWLIPYPFPTLNHQSVQLKKGLGNEPE